MAAVKKQQTLAVHYNEVEKLFHVGSFNADQGNKNKSVNSNVTKAKYIWNKLKSSNDPTKVDDRLLSSGFMLALVNTNFTGWEIIEEVTVEYADAEATKATLVKKWTDLGCTNVGVRNGINKGSGNTGVPSSWHKKFNVENMTRSKILEKVDFISRSIGSHAPNVTSSIREAAYMATVSKTGTINSMGTLLVFIRRELGLP